MYVNLNFLIAAHYFVFFKVASLFSPVHLLSATIFIAYSIFVPFTVVCCAQAIVLVLHQIPNNMYSKWVSFDQQ